MEHEAVVIGCGVVGASVALDLVRRGWKVRVVEREGGAGLGSTKFSSSVIRCHYSHPEAVKLAFEGLRIWQNWGEYLKLDRPRAWYRPVGVLFLYEEKTAAKAKSGALGMKAEMSPAEMRKRAAMMKKLGVRIDFLTSRELAKRFPNLSFNGEVGLYELDSGYVIYPQQAVEDLVEAGRREGVSYQFGRQVVALAPGNKKHRHRLLVETTDLRSEELLTDVVVNAAGPHGAGLNLAFQVPLGLSTVPLRQYIVRGRYAGRRVPTMADLVHGFYCRPDSEAFKIGAVLPSDHREFERDPSGAGADSLMEHHLETLMARAKRRIKGFKLTDVRCELAYYDWTVADSYPILDRTDVEGYYVALGTSGSWFKGAPVIGTAMGELIEQVEAGADHDAKPVKVPLPMIKNTLDLGSFSRKRRPIA